VTFAADSITCSQLSRVSSASRSRIAAMSRSATSAFGAAPSIPAPEPRERRLRHVAGGADGCELHQPDPSGTSPSSVFLDNWSEAAGAIRLGGAVITGQLDLRGTRITAADEHGQPSTPSGAVSPREEPYG
jgi:hypothetical protein